MRSVESGRDRSGYKTETSTKLSNKLYPSCLFYVHCNTRMCRFNETHVIIHMCKKNCNQLLRWKLQCSFLRVLLCLLKDILSHARGADCHNINIPCSRPDNPYDSNCVVVRILCRRCLLLGHLAADVAEQLSSLLLHTFQV